MGSCPNAPASVLLANMGFGLQKERIMKSAYETYTESEVPNRLRDVQHRLAETAKNVTHVTDEYVHDHPWQTVAVAALIGCVIGFLVANRD